MKLIYLLSVFFCAATVNATTLEVRPGGVYSRIEQAAAQALPGDTILVRGGIYGGGEYIENLRGTASAWITIRAAEGESVIYRGGSQALHFSDPAFLRIEGLVFEQQTGNGVNIDDGGSFSTPAHHLLIRNCEWRSMNVGGNNDELKLSGLDTFIVMKCRFSNGSVGGSLVDMVGCHQGIFEENLFENGGSNCIQAKGGTSLISIRRNRFVKGGQRTINIGGSTGLEFFRPPGAKYEAANIYVHSNIFSGSMAPIAFVGAVNSEVVNNTITGATRWVIRILQETNEPGFLPCGNNSFRNNIVVFGNTGQPAINIGPNTAPETFTFSHNLWFNPDNQNWGGPNTPVTEPGRILNGNPLFADSLYRLQANSPALGKGTPVAQPESDFFGKNFLTARAIGAVEGDASTAVEEFQPDASGRSARIIDNELLITADSDLLRITDLKGSVIWQGMVRKGQRLDVSAWAAGLYIAVYGDLPPELFIKE